MRTSASEELPLALSVKCPHWTAHLRQRTSFMNNRLGL